MCDGWCTHTTRRTHMFSDTVSLRDVQTSRTRMAHWSLQCAWRISPSRFLCSHVSSAILVVPARLLPHHVPARTVFVELSSTQKRGSSALPHERRGVWLPGRFHALHRRDSVQNSPTPRNVFSSVEKETTSLKGVAGNCNGAPPRAPCLTVLQEPRGTACRTVSKATCFRVQWVVGNCNDRLKFNYRRPGWTTITCKSQNFGYVEKIFTHLRRKLNRTEDDEMFDLKTNVLIWGLFMSTTMKSATHLGMEYDQNLIACQNTNFEGIKTLFDLSLRLIAENLFEILNLSTVKCDFSPWMKMTPCHDQAIRWATAKVHCVWEE